MQGLAKFFGGKVACVGLGFRVKGSAYVDYNRRLPRSRGTIVVGFLSSAGTIVGDYL